MLFQNHSDDGDLGCKYFEDVCYIFYFNLKLVRIQGKVQENSELMQKDTHQWKALMTSEILKR